MISSEIRKQQLRYPRSEQADKNTALQAVKSMIQQSTDAEVRTNMPQDDATISKFLYARKFDVAETYQLLQNYYWYRRRNPDIFKNFHLYAGDIRKALENGLPGVLTSKDRKGRCVLILNANNWDCSYSLLSVYRWVVSLIQTAFILIKRK